MLTTKNSPGLAKSQPGQEQPVMKVRIVRNTVANKQPVEAGQILELPEPDARLLIAAGKAVFDESVTISDQPEIETAELKVPEMENADLKSTRKKKG